MRIVRMIVHHNHMILHIENVRNLEQKSKITKEGGSFIRYAKHQYHQDAFLLALSISKIK